MICTPCPSFTLSLTSQLIHTPSASLPNRACAHSQPRLTLSQHRRRLAEALITEFLDRDAEYLGVNVDTYASAARAGVRSSRAPERRVR